ncbi:MAG: hypothetical protein U0572_05905 [Phycisphaerales bacterium]
MQLHRRALVASAFALVTLAACQSEPKQQPQPAPPPPAAVAPAPSKPLTVEESARAVLTAKVKAINYATREVTLEDSSGHSIKIVAGKEIARLNEVRVGDTVRIDYVIKLVAELRPPTADETAHPIAVVDLAGRAGEGSAPAGGVMSATRIVTTVEAIDIPNMKLVLRGPLGELTTINARSADNLRKLHIGDTIVIFYGEGLGVSLVKA